MPLFSPFPGQERLAALIQAIMKEKATERKLAKRSILDTPTEPITKTIKRQRGEDSTNYYHR